MEFNAKKCNVLEIEESRRRTTWKYKMGNEDIEKVQVENDLGVMIQDTLS